MATIKELHNLTLSSPMAEASYAFIAENPIFEKAYTTVSGLSLWQILLTAFLGLVAYDQSACTPALEALLRKTNSFTVSYIIQKGSIVGPAFKIPFMGPFLESVNPQFEKYAAKWASGPLSCVSVFHK